MSGNAFQNDGSFLEKFKKMQQEERETDSHADPTSKSAGVSLKLAPAAQRTKQLSAAAGSLKTRSGSAKRVFGGDSDSDGELEGGGSQRG